MSERSRPIVFVLNGKRVSLRVHPLRRLLDVLREDCGLTGTKEGCGEGECGACTVIVDGRAVNACLVPVAQAAGAKVLTIEGLNGRHPLQRAFAAHGGAQCGICTPGMIMAAVALGPRPTLGAVRAGLAGNLCRCTGYAGIYRAIRKAETGSKKQGARRQKAEDRSTMQDNGEHKAGRRTRNARTPSSSSPGASPRLRSGQAAQKPPKATWRRR